jgi:polygalacturonase
MVPRRVAALAAALALLAPATAFAQSAGDEQYQDPFGGDEQEQSQEPDTSTSSGDDQGTTTTQAPAPTSAPEATTAQAAPAAAAAQLPRTGGDVVLPAVAGFWLLLGGVALRARVRLDDRGA